MFSTPSRHSTAKRTCHTAEGSFQLLPNRRLRLCFSKKKLSPSMMQRYFGEGHFVMETPIDLPLSILGQLGIESYTICAGIYPVQETKDLVMVEL